MTTSSTGTRARGHWGTVRKAAVWCVPLCLCAPVPGAAQSWQRADSTFRWSFPRDHWSHPAYRTEWWYFTGHLVDEADTTRRFGYQFTFFRIGILPMAVDSGSDWAATMMIMGHASISDLDGNEHRFAETLYRAVPMLGGFGAPGDTMVAWSRGPAGTEGRWTLRWTGGGFAFAMADDRQGIAFDLRTRPERPLVFQGPNGLSRKHETRRSASLYYSMTRLATSGSVTIGGRRYQVRGRSWMDKEFGSGQLSRDQVGWDWFSLQLDDGRDLMLYSLRDSTGAVNFASGTVVEPGGRTRYLSRRDFTVQATGRWRSDSSQAEYPSAWRIEVPEESLRIDVAPAISDQENNSSLLRFLFYWEGAVYVTDPGGRRLGQGYVELVGYGRGMRPAL